MYSIRRAIALFTLMQTPVAIGETALVTENGSNTYRAIKASKTSGNLKFSQSLFSLQQGTSNMYGTHIEAGYSMYRYGALDVYGVGGAGVGLITSPPVETDVCIPPDNQQTRDESPRVDPNSPINQIVYTADQIADATEDFKKTQRAANYAACINVKSLKENTSRYGGMLYYRYGIAPTIVYKHLLLEAFIGKEIEHKASFLDKGEIDLNHSVVKFGIGISI